MGNNKGLLSKSFILHFFAVSILGAARFSIEIGSINIKISFFVLFVFFLFYFFNGKVKFCFIEIFLFLVIVFFGVISLYFSTRKNVTIYYILWLLADFFVVYGFFRSLSLEKGVEYIKKLYVFSFRWQILLSLILFPFFQTPDGRYALYYYESSYFAIAAIPYISFVVHDFFIKERKIPGRYLDFLFVFVLLYLTKSANLMLILIISFLFTFLFLSKVSFFKRLSFVFCSIIVFLAFLFILFYLNRDNLIISTIFNLFSTPDYFQNILVRTGNRWPRMLLALDVIYHNFPNGIGMGAFKYYTLNYMPDEDYSRGIDFLNPIGMPATNIWLETLSEIGLGGLIGFVLLNLFILKRAYSVISVGLLPVFVALLTFYISLSFESSYLRLYLWAFMGVAFGSAEKVRRSLSR